MTSSPESRSYSFDLFVSYSSANSSIDVGGTRVRAIEHLKRALEGHVRPPGQEGTEAAASRFRVCTFEADFELRDSVRQAIRDRIDASRQVLVIVSEASAGSSYVREEIAYFRQSRAGELPLTAMLDKSPADAFPDAFGEDTHGADLTVEIGMSARDWRRKVERESHKIVARVWGCELREVYDRFVAESRAQRARFLASLVGGVALVALLGGAVQILRNPTHAWTEPHDTRSIEFDGGAVVIDDDGSERIRAWGSYASSGVFAEDVGERRHVIRELDERGRVLGCVAFAQDDGDPAEAPAEIAACGGLGTLAPEWRASTDRFLELTRLRWIHQRATVALPLRSDRERLSTYSIFEDEYADSTHPEDGLSDAFGGQYDLGARGETFQLAPLTQLFSVGLLHREERSVASAFALTIDGGRTWRVPGARPLALNVAGLTGLAWVATQPGTFYLSAQEWGWEDDFTAGGLWVTRDDLRTWDPLVLPEPWRAWTAYAGVATEVSGDRRVAVALLAQRKSRHRRPKGVPGVLLSEDAGETWQLLDTGLDVPSAAVIRLLGITSGGNVVALGDTNGDGTGRMIVWRRLDMAERFAQSFGVSLGT